MLKKKSQQKHSLPQQSGSTQQVQAHVTETRIETFSGPLPKPDVLLQYNQIVPGAADRIIRMAEQQAGHRQTLEKIVIEGDTKRAYLGLWVGAFVALCMLGGSVFLIYTGHDWAGTVIASLDIVGLASVFVYGTVSRRRERIRKATLVNPPNPSSG